LNELKTRELTFLTNIGRKTVFEISTIELVNFKIIVVCIYIYIYISPNSNVDNFLELLEQAVNKVLLRGRFLFLCGDWNINLLVDNTQQKALISILLSNNLLNTIPCPTRVTPTSSSLIDVMIRNKIFYHSSTKVVEMGFSDHFALVMNILVKRPATFSINIVKRVFSQRKHNNQICEEERNSPELNKGRVGTQDCTASKITEVRN
jgi:hypothetical protein